jgi:hypothetical protein
MCWQDLEETLCEFGGCRYHLSATAGKIILSFSLAAELGAFSEQVRGSTSTACKQDVHTFMKHAE